MAIKKGSGFHLTNQNALCVLTNFRLGDVVSLANSTVFLSRTIPHFFSEQTEKFGNCSEKERTKKIRRKCTKLYTTDGQFPVHRSVWFSIRYTGILLKVRDRYSVVKDVLRASEYL